MNTTVQNENRSASNRPAREEYYVSPDVNIFETADGYVLEAEMPGVSKDGLEITVDGTEITITGRRKEETVTGDVLFRERNPANYRRVFDLDPVIDTGQIAARLEKGLLTLTLPKSERAKPRKIEVN